MIPNEIKLELFYDFDWNTFMKITPKNLSVTWHNVTFTSPNHSPAWNCLPRAFSAKAVLVKRTQLKQNVCSWKIAMVLFRNRIKVDKVKTKANTLSDNNFKMAPTPSSSFCCTFWVHFLNRSKYIPRYQHKRYALYYNFIFQISVDQLRSVDIWISFANETISNAAN